MSTNELSAQKHSGIQTWISIGKQPSTKVTRNYKRHMYTAIVIGSIVIITDNDPLHKYHLAIYGYF